MNIQYILSSIINMLYKFIQEKNFSSCNKCESSTFHIYKFFYYILVAPILWLYLNEEKKDVANDYV